MEAMLLQFLVGTIGGTAIGLLEFKRAGRKTRKRRSSARKSKATRASRTRKAPLGKAATMQQSMKDTIGSLPKPASPSLEDFSSCPSCGLVGTNSLLSEHFLSSPSHPLGNRVEKNNESEAETIAKDHNRPPDNPPEGLARSLLTMLAPPRAFGRRHSQRSEQPISQVVGGSRLLPLPPRLSMGRMRELPIALTDN